MPITQAVINQLMDRLEKEMCVAFALSGLMTEGNENEVGISNSDFDALLFSVHNLKKSVDETRALLDRLVVKGETIQILDS